MILSLRTKRKKCQMSVCLRSLFRIFSQLFWISLPFRVTLGQPFFTFLIFQFKCYFDLTLQTYWYISMFLSKISDRHKKARNLLNPWCFWILQKNSKENVCKIVLKDNSNCCFLSQLATRCGITFLAFYAVFSFINELQVVIYQLVCCTKKRRQRTSSKLPHLPDVPSSLPHLERLSEMFHLNSSSACGRYQNAVCAQQREAINLETLHL